MKKVVWIIVFILLTWFILSFYSSFYGNPIGKYLAKRQVSNYMKIKYTEEMIIDKVYYNFDYGTYHAIAYPKDNKGLYFRISRVDQKPGLKDDYFVKVWDKALENEVRDLLSENNIITSRIFVVIDKNPLYDQYTTNVSEVPKFKDISSKVENYTTLYLYFDRNFEFDNRDTEVGVLLKIVEFTKDETY